MADTPTIRVVARFRPLSADELASSSGATCVTFPSPTQVAIGLSKPTARSRSEGSVRTQTFSFSSVLPPETTQTQVYADVGPGTLTPLLEGKNVAVVAYGQTGAGKTHTMQGYGNGEDAGLVPRLLRQVIEQVGADAELHAQYIEVYREVVRDLLAPESAPAIKLVTDPDTKVVVPRGAVQVPVVSLDDINAVMEKGNAHRAVAAHKQNEVSSRSHALFILTLVQRNALDGASMSSRLYLVDLAGSEKVSKTEVAGLQLHEAKSINKALLALGNVIAALSGSKGGRGSKSHVPYRDSKLTRLLSACFGGNATTTLIVCASPATYNATETLSTLRFGDRSSKIRNVAVVNKVHSADSLLKRVQEQNNLISEQAAEIERLRALLAAGASSAARAPPGSRFSIASSHLSDDSSSIGGDAGDAPGEPLGAAAAGAAGSDVGSDVGAAGSDAGADADGDADGGADGGADGDADGDGSDPVPALCVAPFEAMLEHEIDLAVGAVVTVVGQDMDGGVLRVQHDGEVGEVPAAHLLMGDPMSDTQAVVLFHFDAELPTEATVPYAGIVDVLGADMDDAPGWTFVRFGTSAGLVPEDYLQVLGRHEDADLVAATLGPEYDAIEDGRVAEREAAYHALRKGGVVRVSAPFKAADDAELTVAPGDILRVLDRRPPSWIYARRESSTAPVSQASDASKGKGLVPFGYVVIIDDGSAPAEPPSLPPRSSSRAAAADASSASTTASAQAMAKAKARDLPYL